jgi:integrase
MAKEKPFTPATLDVLSSGRMRDPETPGLALEVLRSGKKHWLYRRRVAKSQKIVCLVLGRYPAYSIAAAREWAGELNLQVERGANPAAEMRAENARAAMTVARAHGLYMHAVREGRASRAKRKNKPRTISDKLELYNRDIAPALASRCIYDVTERDLILLVEAKGRRAKIRANRLAAELKVFFGWAASLRGTEVGLEIDPSRRLSDLKFPEASRTRRLSLDEIELFLKALVGEERHFQRGMLLWLLTAARFSEVIKARRDELVGDVWVIDAPRVKNSVEHRIALGPWGRSLMLTNSDWVFPADRVDGPRTQGWYKARDRVRARMEELAGRPIDRFTPHDFRRTARSNTKRLDVDVETAEAMLNHLKTPLQRTYDQYELEDEKRAWFLKWEQEIVRLAFKAGVTEALGVPPEALSRSSATSPERADARIAPIFGGGSPQLVFATKVRWTALSQPTD